METQVILGPLMLDPILKEPFIQLPHPHENIRITPPRMSDTVAIVSILNDEKVYPFLVGPPFPYTETDAVAILTTRKATCDVVLKEIYEPNDQQAATFSGCPVRCIRQLLPGGGDVFLGEMGIFRNSYVEILDTAKRAETVSKNNAKAMGDASIVWCFGSEHVSPPHPGCTLIPVF